jgi:hypothetical protein
MTKLNTTVASLLAVIMITSVVAPMAAPIVAGQSSGMTTVPGEQVGVSGERVDPGRPPQSELGTPGNGAPPNAGPPPEVVDRIPSQALQNIRASEGAASLTVEAAATTDGSLALVLTDDQNSAGRRVSVPVTVFEESMGRVPDVVYGTHEDGSTWQTEPTVEDGFVTFEVPHFSTNTVTFSGRISLAGAYTNGSTVSYDVSSADAVDDFNISVIGNTTSETDTFSVPMDGSASDEIAGSSIPSSSTVDVSWSTSGGVSLTDSGDYTAPPVNDTVTDGLSDVSSGTLQVSADGTSISWARLRVYVDGTEAYDTEKSLPNDGSLTDFNVDLSNYNNVDTYKASLTWEDTGETLSVNSGLYLDADEPDSVDVTLDGATKTWTSEGTKTISIDDDTSINASTAATGGNSVSTNVTYTETQDTVDPTISVNGHSTSYSGTLDDGATASLSTNSSWVESGTNTVEVSFSDISSDAPAPTVDLDYSHDAKDKISVNYTANKWSEKYNVSHTYSDASSNANLTIPHEGNVVAIDRVEKSVNGGSWTSVDSSNYNLDGTTLTVQLGDLSSGDKVEVRTTGRRVAVVDGAITVVDPTTTGDRLDTKIRLDSWSDGAHIGVGGTPDGRKIHYTYNEDSGGDEYVRIESSGVQQLYLPAAAAGSEMRVSTIPVQADVQTGSARFEVRDPKTTEPQFSVAPDGTAGDDVEFTFVDATDDQKYILYSKTQGVVHDSGTANSPLTLTDDDSEETLQFQEEDSGSGDGGSEEELLGPVEPQGDGPLNSVPIILLAYAGVLIALYLVDRGGQLTVRNPIPSMVPFVGGRRVRVPLPGSQGPLFWGGSILSTLIVLEFLSSGLVSRTIFRTVTGLTDPLGEVVPLAGIVAIGLLGYYLYRRFIVGQDDSRDIVIRSDGGDDR